MKLIKSYVVYNVTRQIHKPCYSLIENEVASSIDLSDVIKDFAAIKLRKVQFYIFDQCHIRELIFH
jgi:hypothetical protein